MDYTTNALGLQELIVTNYQETEKNISVFAETKPSPQICPCCRQKTAYIHGYRQQKIKDLVSHAKPVDIFLRKRRYLCKSCGKTFFEHYSFLTRYRHFTDRYFCEIIDRLSTTRSLTSISKEFSCSVTTVQRVLDFVPEPVSKPLPHVLGIDEFKGNTDKEKYQCILVDLENGTVFDVLPTRKKPDLINYFKKYSNRTEVRYFVMDMTNNYRDLDFLFPNATVIADKFHYIRQVYWGLDNVRKRIQKEYSKNKRIYFKHSRKLLFKDLEDLKEEEKEELQIMLSQSDDLYRAWVLKDNFKYFRQAKTREEAERELHIWIGSAEESGFEEFKNAITAFRNWRVEILNSVIYPYSNGQTEGFNNKIKVLKRNAYGFRKFKNLRKRIQLNCIKDGNQAVA